MAAHRRIYDSRHLRLTAQNRDQLRNPTLGSRVWATFSLPFFLYRERGRLAASTTDRRGGAEVPLSSMSDAVSHTASGSSSSSSISRCSMEATWRTVAPSMTAPNTATGARTSSTTTQRKSRRRRKQFGIGLANPFPSPFFPFLSLSLFLLIPFPFSFLSLLLSFRSLLIHPCT